MDYIIFNGIDSRSFKNLIVTSLPPITKPRVRSRQINIDGRDGVLVETLGYESYTKTVSLGLTSSENVDRILGWLEGVGHLILSNEPDKFYRVQVLEQIDVTAFLRFKTADVTFLVQPFKFSQLERIRTVNTDGLLSTFVCNTGNIFSKPKITLYGTGEVTMKLEDEEVFTLNFDYDEFITVDSDRMDAYAGDALKNRQMFGTFPRFKVGMNKLSWTGNLTKLEIEYFSRWL